jgi:hypothetical protein
VVIATDGRIGVSAIVSASVPGSVRVVHTQDVVHMARNIAAAKLPGGERAVSLSAPSITNLLTPFANAPSVAAIDSLFVDLTAPEPVRAIFNRYELAARTQMSNYIMANLVDQNVRITWLGPYIDAPRFRKPDTQAVESFNAAILKLGMRNVPIRAALLKILPHHQFIYNAIRDKIGVNLPPGTPNSCLELHPDLYPHFGSLAFSVQKAIREVPTMKVTAVGGQQALVQALVGQSSFTVDGAKRSCSCGVPQTVGIPCVHVCAVAHAGGGARTIAHFTAHGLLRAHLFEAFSYKCTMVAIDVQSLAKDGLVKGPLRKADGSTVTAKKKRGPKKNGKRTASVGEHEKDERGTSASSSTAQTSSTTTTSTTTVAPAKKRKQVCKKCGAEGHNSKTCGKTKK